MRVYLTFLLCCYATLALTQNQTIFLQDEDESTPIDFASVYVVEGADSLRIIGYTDLDGQFELADSFPANTRLRFRHLNYHDRTVSIYQVLSNEGVVYMRLRAIELRVPVVIGASKFEEILDEVPTQVDILTEQDFKLYNTQTTADALTQTGNVFVQKSQMGGGSPVIRGFEANKVLLVLDGVRMNNAIYRSGHLQNVITIDNAVIERAEVHHGASSVMYGSDALGGVMHFYTKKPKLQDSKTPQVQASAYTRFATANFEKTAHADVNIGTRHWAGLTSFSYSNFDDLRAGRVKIDSNMAQAWNRYFYVEHEAGKDYVRINENPNVQVGTAYKQMDFLQKLRYHPSDRLDILMNVQYSTTNDIPRYDQLTEGNVAFQNGQITSKDFKYAEWNYGPQNRFLFSTTATLEQDSSPYFSTAKFIAAFQRIDEDRITRRFDDVLRRYQKEDVYVFTLNADFIKRFKHNQKLLYGAEVTHNLVGSNIETVNILTQERSSRGIGTRYPDGGSTMSTASAYLSYRFKISDVAHIITAGRLTHTTLQANFDDTSLYRLPYQKIQIHSDALTGSAALAWKLPKQWQLNWVTATAFRTPNVDDVGKIRAKGGTVTVPNPNIKPEQALNFDLTIKKQFKKQVNFRATAFYTYLFDAIVQENFTLNGADSLYYDGSFENIQAQVNTGQAYVWGLSGGLTIEFGEHALFQTSLNYTNGWDITQQSPLDHIPPLFGQTSFAYQRRAFRMELLLRFNGPKPTRLYGNGTADNWEKALPNGTPAWFTMNMYTSYQLSRRLSLNIAMENIFDWHYRPFASGVSAPGQNLIITLRGNFGK